MQSNPSVLQPNAACGSDSSSYSGSTASYPVKMPLPTYLSFTKTLKPASPCHCNIVGIFECEIINAICSLKTQQLLLLHLIPLHLSPSFYLVTLPLLVHKEKGMSYFVSKISMISKEKLKCTLVHALRLCTGCTAHRGIRGIALLFLDHGTRRR